MLAISDCFFSGSGSSAAFSLSFGAASGTLSWFHGSLVESSSVSIEANPALPNSMSSERGVLRNLFMIPENFGKLIEAKNLVSFFFSSLLSAAIEAGYCTISTTLRSYLSYRHYLKPLLLWSSPVSVLRCRSSSRKDFAI